MSFGAAVKTCMSKYADFNGRARRSEFWWFYLFLQLVYLPFTIAWSIAYVYVFVSATDSQGYINESNVNFIPLIVTSILLFLVSIAFILPTYAAMVRRLHDMGQSGWWLLLAFLGFGFVPLVMCFFDSQPQDNQYGPNPKAGGQAPFPGYAQQPPPPLT